MQFDDLDNDKFNSSPVKSENIVDAEEEEHSCLELGNFSS